MVFVPFVAAGETVRVEVVREHKSYLEARLLGVEDPSPRRVDAALSVLRALRRVQLPAPRRGRTARHQAAAGRERAAADREIHGDRRRGDRPLAARVHYRNRITVHARDGVVGILWPRRGPGPGVDRHRAMPHRGRGGQRGAGAFPGQSPAARGALHPARGPGPRRRLRPDQRRRGGGIAGARHAATIFAGGQCKRPRPDAPHRRLLRGGIFRPAFERTVRAGGRPGVGPPGRRPGPSARRPARALSRRRRGRAPAGRPGGRPARCDAAHRGPARRGFGGAGARGRAGRAARRA